MTFLLRFTLRDYPKPTTPPPELDILPYYVSAISVHLGTHISMYGQALILLISFKI